MPTSTDTRTRIAELIAELKELDGDDRLAAETELAAIVTALPTNFLGPTWQVDEDDDWILPEYTLGIEIAAWAMTWLAHPKSTDENPMPWQFTNEQLRFLLWWYAIDENGRFLFRKGVLQRLKGWGKDPLLAVIAIVEFVGPCRFSHWERDGRTLGWDEAPTDAQPKCKPELNSLVQVAAVSQEQTTNTSDMFPILMTQKLIKKYGIKVSQEILRARNGRQQVKMVTSSYRALEGKRSTFVVLNETHHWVLGNDGHKMYETVDGNVTKGGGEGARYLAITNAYLPGEDSVAERMRHSWQNIQEGKAVDIGFLYDSVEANQLVPLHPVALNIVIPIIRGDAVWLDVMSILSSIQDESIPVYRSRRMWLNQVTSDEDSLYSEPDWDLLESSEYLKPGDTIVLGLDGGRTDDSTALIAIRVSDCLAVPLGIWEKPDIADRWTVDHLSVNSRVTEAFRVYNVVGFYSDVREWESFVLNWSAEYGERLLIKSRNGGAFGAVGWDMRSSLKVSTRAHERLVQTILDGQLKWSKQNSRELSTTLRRHVLNVYRDEKTFGQEYGVYFRKQSRESRRKVDAYAALMLAHECRNDYLIRGEKPDETTNRVWFMR